ncbi:hypothetical protein [Bradyrhizobium brasilense]|uniref:hypothetical protein n=1 Tax=Bradyrhizobium brasilense TaxID=1419277 RepID=UPI001E4990BC|nr:hypothetical protein [Bradyrhizobium brasilense]MCC8971583.1 hypothetical protein [Bradyrhizobium brasilense]
MSNVLDDVEQSDEEALACDISDEALEIAAGAQWEFIVQCPVSFSSNSSGCC